MDQQRHERQRTVQHASYPTRHPDYSRLPMLDSPTNKFPFPPPTPFPGLPTRPLNIHRLRHSPSLPLTVSPSPTPAPEFKIDGRHISYPVRTSSSRVLRRTQTTAGSGRSAVHRRESVALTFKEPPVVEHKTPRTSWLQRSTSKRESVGKGVTAVAAAGKEKKKEARLRSATEPARLLGLHDNQASQKRATSASEMGVRVKNRMGAFALGSSENIEQDEDHEHALRTKAKGWRQRMFSREKKDAQEKQPSQKRMSFEKPRVSFEEPRSRTSSAGSVASSTRSDKTVLNDKATPGTAKENICQLDIPSKLTVATAGSQDSHVRTGLAAVEQWQVGGGGSRDFHEPQHELLQKSMDEGVIGLFEERMAGLLNLKPERYTQHWKPPVLSLELKAVADVVKVPVTVEATHDIWVALTLNGTVGGDADIAAANTATLGLDVGVLMDTS